MTKPRTPAYRRTRLIVSGEAGEVSPVGTLEMDLLETREMTAWMQQVGDLLGRSADSVSVTSLTDRVDALDTRLGAVEQAVADSGSAVAVGLELDAHRADHKNPHVTTAAQVGADPSGTASTLVAEEASDRASGDAANASALAAHEADTSTHGVGLVLGSAETQAVSNKTLDATNKFGGASNYSAFEADGTLVATGDATTWNDSQAAVIYMRSGGTALTQDVLAGGIYQYRFDKADEVHSQIQLSHTYKVNSTIDLHIHLINKAAVGATSYNVGIVVEYMWLSLNTAAAATPTTTLATVNCSFQNAAALTHKVFQLATVAAPTEGGSISSILFLRIGRVAGTTQDLAGNNIFIAGFDCHVEQDTMGSRQEYLK